MKKPLSAIEQEREKTINYLLDIIHGRRPGFFIGFVKSSNTEEKGGVVGEVFSSMYNLSISKVSIAGIKGLNSLIESAEKRITEQKTVGQNSIINPPSTIISEDIHSKSST